MIKKMGNTEESFGRLIKHLRIEKGMTIQELSEITNLSSSYISRIETEERKNLTMDAVNRFKYAFDLDIRVIERLFPFPEGENKLEKEFRSIEEVLLNNKFLFSGKLASIEIQFCLRQIIKALEQYAIQESCNREDESNILKLADNLRKEVAKAT